MCFTDRCNRGAGDVVRRNRAYDNAKLRKHTDKPISVGFGVSTAEQVEQVAEIADGVIVGSAIVNVIEDNMDNEAQLLAAVKQFASDLAGGVKM